MGLFDKLVVGGGVAVVGVVARSWYKDAQETKRRKNSPLRFDRGVSQTDFIKMAQDTARHTPRVEEISVAGMTTVIRVRSNSGLSTWDAEIDFNDYGRLTGTYWISSENPESIIPQHFAEKLRGEIGRHAGHMR